MDTDLPASRRSVSSCASLPASVLALPPPPPPPRAADRCPRRLGRFDRGAACEAVARPIAAAGKRDAVPYVAIAFDRAGPRQGQLFAQLRRPTRPGSSVLLTVGDQPFLLVARGAHAWSRIGARKPPSLPPCVPPAACGCRRGTCRAPR